MVCDVYLGLSREGVGDLGRNWLDAGDERIEKNIVQVYFCEGVMLSTACDVCLRRRCGVVLNVGVGDMGQKAKPEGCESTDSKEYSASIFPLLACTEGA